MDFCDKLVISITLVIVTVFCVLNTFCFGYDTKVDMTYLFSCNLSPATGLVGQTVRLVDNAKYFSIFEIPVYYGYSYDIEITQPSNLSGSLFVRLISFDNVPKIGSYGLVEEYITISPGTTKNIHYSVNNIKQEKLYICLSFNGDGVLFDKPLNVNITTDYVPNGFSDSINLLVQDVSFTGLWLLFEKLIPFIAIVVLGNFLHK